MKRQIRADIIVLALLLFATTGAFAQVPQPGYVPPDAEIHGLAAHNEHLAVIETNCTDVETAIEMRNALTRNGALVSLITSPGRMLAWVPPAARDAVAATKLESATGSLGVLSVSYSSAEFARNRSVDQPDAVENEADEAIVEYLDFIKRPLTAEDLQRIEEREKEIEELMPTIDAPECSNIQHIDEAPPYEITGGMPVIGGEQQDQVDRRTRLKGFIVHSSFFLESASGTGSWNWDPVVYTRYRNFYIAGMNYWVSFAARYGKTISTWWRLYSPNHSATQINGEPVSVGEHTFIPQVVIRLAMPSIFDWPPSWSGIGAGTEWCWWYNKKVRQQYNANDAICGFIAYKPSGGEQIWPHASVVSWNNGDREGVYFAMDTRYWQAKHDPFSAPMRNVVAHEIGHLFGAPDEYRNDNCSWTYRGIPNINCQTLRPAHGRPGFNMRGWDGMMKGNYTGGNSSATPVHTGVISASQTAPVRIYHSTPTNISLQFENCDGVMTRNWSTPIGVAVDYDYCHKVTAPASVFRSGQTWYFDQWVVTRKSGSTTNISYYANELRSTAYSSSFSNPVTDIRAVFTNSPPDIFSSNTTLEAALAPVGFSGSPNPGIGLKWRNRYNMSDVKTIIEYEASSGNWRPLSSSHYTLGPFHVPIGQWTGVHIHSVPNSTGSGSSSVQSNRLYRFRIVGEFNTNRGNPSVVATVTTRPSAPADTVYCYDGNEPNTLSNPRQLTSSGPGMETYSIKAAIPITPRMASFTWFVPVGDYYRITVINVSNLIYGEKLAFKLRVRDGSDFRPRLRAQRVGTSTHINANYSGGVYTLNLSNDGEYLIKVESNISQSISYDFVDRTGGHFGFGEYEMTVERTHTQPGLTIPCLDCYKLVVMKPFPGELIMRPHPEFKLFTSGVDPSTPRTFEVYYQTPPGYSFLGFGGSFGDMKENPAQLSINPDTPPGEYEIYPIIEPSDNSMAELVVIYPEGPDGPFEDRTSASIGSVVTAEAKAPEGYTFAGWSGDTTGTTNPIQVTLWRSKRLIAQYRPVPCDPEPMTTWRHELLLRNSRQNEVSLIYGMADGAGDGLEAGQIDLPPIPPPTALDIRWINITASQGSTTDLRAIKSSHIFQGRVQTGGTAPVTMSWGAPAASPDASYTLRVQGTPGSINMRTQSNYEFVDEGTYIFTVEVKEGACPEPTKENEIDVTTVDINNRDWPCMELTLQLRERSSGELRPYYNPYFLQFGEKLADGSVMPMELRSFTQMDSTLIVRLCGDDENKDPGREREVIVINDNDDDDQQRDTTVVRIPPPIPDGDGDPERFVLAAGGDWEMVSTPLLLKEAQTDQIFSDPNLRLYAFDTDQGTYIPAEEMEFGRGYWLKAEPFETVLIGLSQPSYEWNDLSGIGEPAGYGWNMIGSMFKEVAVAAIEQVPAGGMKAIFGWDPSQGYIVPTSIIPGKGYWVRVDPDTRLRMSINSFTGGGSNTAYQKTVDRLDLASLLTIEDATGATRPLYISGTNLEATERAQLALPAVPPTGAFDVRTAEGDAFVFAGENLVELRGDGRMVLSMPVSSARVRIEVLDERDQLLQVFSGNAGEHVLVDVAGSRTLKLRVTVQPPVSGAHTLGSNYPNPFRVASRTYIPYAVRAEGAVRLTIYDMLGRKLRTLVDGTQPEGSKLANWDGRDRYGNVLPAGIYTYRLETADGIVSRTLTIVK
ncbi:MAG: T9SS type A sorting domain-containing protein [Bacteroidetes bacterium]|nr:T9SS type A sorting domain-containing protein [Bacteroidota bacterium]